MYKDGIGGIEGRLALLGLTLPAPPTPEGNYVPWVRTGSLLFVGGNVGSLNGAAPAHTGRLGAEVSVAQGYEILELLERREVNGHSSFQSINRR